MIGIQYTKLKVGFDTIEVIPSPKSLSLWVRVQQKYVGFNNCAVHNFVMMQIDTFNGQLCYSLAL